MLLVVQAVPSLRVVGLDRSRRVVHVGLAGAELLEAAAGPGLVDGDLAPGLAFWNSSATASVIGKTVLEPSTVYEPVSGSADGLTGASLEAALAAALAAADGDGLAPPLQAAAMATAEIARAATRFVGFTRVVPPAIGRDQARGHDSHISRATVTVGVSGQRAVLGVLSAR